ncbi:CoA transferase [Cytophagales bacterium WSM2-2]|nr:CoA transferase [Cytophagales bacterium WSM2-2]
MDTTLQNKKMFAGLRVLELASVLAGPSVGQFFAELGAEVIKVENPKTGGDVTRSWKMAGEKTDDRSAYFCSCNWGKKSVALDLTLKNDQEIVKKLSNRSDIVIASYKPGDAEKLGVSYEQLRVTNDKLIYGQISGYGSDDDRVGYDAVIQAESGFMDLNGEENGPPIKMPVALIDILAAHHLKEGLLLALLNLQRSGKGDLVEVSLIQAAVSSLANQATNWLVGNNLPVRQGSAHPNIAPYGDSFLTKDGRRILLAVGSDRQFEDLKEVIGIERDTLTEFARNQQRVARRDELNKLLSDRIGNMESRVLIQQLNSKKIPAGFIQNLKEVFEMPQAAELIISQNGISGVRNFAARLKNHALDPQNLIAPPHLGEHTQEVMKSIQ